MGEKSPAPEISEDERKLELGCSSSVSAAPEQVPATTPPIQPDQPEPSFYEKLVSILGVRDEMSTVAAADTKFDKQALTSLHNKVGIYLPRPEIGEVFLMHETPEQEFEVSHEATEPADELVPVKLEDLKVGKRNECVVLHGELCVEPFKFGRIYTVLEEMGTNNAVALSIVSPDPSSINQSFARYFYPRGLKIAVKEPWLVQSESGLVFICVDNPLSIEMLQSLPSPADGNVTVGQEKINNWMDCIVEAFEAEEWGKCIRNCSKCEMSYIKGIIVDGDLSVLDIYSFRYLAQMELGLYEVAQEDLGYISMNPSHAFGVDCEIRSLLSLGRYKEAYRLLHRACVVDDYGDNDRKKFIEFYRGWGSVYFDIGEAIVAGAGASTKCSIPDGDLLGPVEIRNTNYGCGRGLFATEDIEVGQLLLLSKALAISRKAMEDPIRNGLLQNVKDALSSCGDNTLKLFLCHGRGGNNLERMIPRMWDFFRSGQDDNGSTVTVRETYDMLPDKDQEILHILKLIALEDSSPGAVQENGKLPVMMNPVPNRLYYGVWLLVSFINHSCVPNAARMNVGDMMRVHATKRIEKGQEITIPYFGVLLPYHLRHKCCEAFGFCCECKCRRCKLEKKVIESESKAHRLYNDYQKIINSNKKNTATQLQKFVYQIDKCLEVLRSKNIVTDKESEGWIRSSFMAAYMARIDCRKSKGEKESIEEENKTLLTAVRSVGATCPGDIQYLIFCQSCLFMWRGLAVAANQWAPSLNIYANLASGFLQEACRSVYGSQRKDVMRLLLERFDIEEK